MPKRLRQMADELIREVYIHIYDNEKYEQSKQEQGLHISSEYPDDICTNNWKSPNKKG